MKLIKSITRTNADIVKCHNTSEPMRRHRNETLTLYGFCIFDKEDNSPMITSIITNKGSFASNSQSIKDSCLTLLNFMKEEEIKKGIEIKIATKESRNRREYLVIDLV